MPIYGFNGTGMAPYSRVTDIKRDKLSKFVTILEKAKKEFMYSHDEIFCRNIELNLFCKDTSYVAKYNMFRTGIDESTYIFRLEALINEANVILAKNKYSNYRFDIMGSWTMGQIILMEMKK